MLALLLLAAPALDFTWIEERAELRAAWERCVHSRVVDFSHDTDALPETIVGRAMLACGTKQGAYAARVRSIDPDPVESGIQIAEAESAVRREALRWAVQGRERAF